MLLGMITIPLDCRPGKACSLIAKFVRSAVPSTDEGATTIMHRVADLGGFSFGTGVLLPDSVYSGTNLRSFLLACL